MSTVAADVPVLASVEPMGRLGFGGREGEIPGLRAPKPFTA